MEGEKQIDIRSKETKVFLLSLSPKVLIINVGMPLRCNAVQIVWAHGRYGKCEAYGRYILFLIID